ncbi:MAG: bifunctional 23S rRNA (guanine(2069)-N(7))-methyltransferase RlmK/23S rRNA (guanine(2445)-N(2))-methyltransferase RlmL [Oceanospirillaceae bacterium]|uniref:bifunctional 23S rRNA (guanine(2069)-N(7))-methyltransferase RlmK/23S rRNA (guanine(2445)-N(2))-methyltransferase RlmL n=1 Tax=unclassified Thalassolituus TaxID=2624967 RepID=UPI000C58D2A2|nr:MULTISPECIES: bifunctional 23S rRNA (guanine(2069)-N(7))-methyltransferase RlmK/23S rRNA (guanine(2445)-N(2))-methyltransferase RlmL [unclassified Thalassolituus]MAS24846.1 bifunctional 23S rRNA (guanine(2069)-N(7))-methyltransferase RlmK/23S rRNA (guanine(2445)-N(2))-methyltransferase RlmL [Oceanospirillaceae bacterium]MBS52100.1 bifunctional 23S rRNA (guanine(2069)-N(7))-methyltransferase RlmK/23S rRNA (guanine(2445)-N(2))-methyltransferase RlmL [Oceanospirillaceae bacterium]
MQNETPNAAMTFLAACPKGIEPLLADEINGLGGIVERETHLGVHWRGDIVTAYRFCLWSRLASRLLLPLQESQVDSVDDVYRVANLVDWPMLFPVKASFRIDFHGRTDYLNNTQFGAQKIKDAIVDRFREDLGGRPSVSKDADIRIEAQLRKGKLYLYLNLSGDSLHRRGYRLQPGKAPLKENLAAAILIRAGWPEMAKEGKHLVDPMCGSGTLVMEAGMIAADIAPGLNRQKWGFDEWLGHRRDVWLAEVESARKRRTEGLNAMKNRLYGFDIDTGQLSAAAHNLSRSALAGKAHFEKRDIENLRIQQDTVADGGLVVCNPPYGERLSELPQLAPLYQKFHDATMKLPDWRLAVFTGNVDLAKSIRRPLDKQYKFMNGQIQTRLLVFGAADERSEQPQVSMIRGPVEAFANRLKKNLKQLNKWAKRENVHCLRLYDADIPEYAVAVDRYEDWLHVQEYVPPKSVDESKAERRLLDILAVLPEITEIPSERIVLKRRERQSGRKQYEKQNTEQHYFNVREGQVQLRVNLKDYLDTGLFLDHRPTRLFIAEQAGGKRFLNLFCYTATASVHAAAAGAFCTSVDMSRTYLNWGRDNFSANDLDPQRHEFIQADCLQWLADAAEENLPGRSKGYDLIFMDPPTFSNSKRMEGVLDIQRDHGLLIQQAMACLNPGGLLIFSTNLRRFEMDIDALNEFTIKDVSSKSVPFDFSRRQNIHHCFHISR